MPASIQDEEEIRKTIRSTRKSLRTQVSVRNAIAVLFLLAVLFGIIASYQVCKWVAGQPQVQPFDFQYAAAEDWQMTFEVRYDEGGLPMAVRRIPAAERILPTIEIDGKSQSTPLPLQKTTPSSQSVNLPLEFKVPRGTIPGTYTATVVCKSLDGKVERHLTATIEALDAFASFRKALLYYLGITAVFAFWCFRTNPAPFGVIHTLNGVTTYNNDRAKDRVVEVKIARDLRYRRVLFALLAIYALIYWISRGGLGIDIASPVGLGVIAACYVGFMAVFFSAQPISRSQKSLSTLDPDMPSGVLVYVRTFPIYGGSRGVSVALWVLEENQEERANWKQMSRWPQNLAQIRDRHTTSDLLYNISSDPLMDDDLPDPILANATRKFAFGYSKGKD